MNFYSDFRHGSAREATLDEKYRAGLYEDDGGVYIGICPETKNYMTLAGDAPITLIGGAGTGKNTDILAYTNFYPGSMLYNDPKGEWSATTRAHKLTMGRDFYCINPYGLHTKAPWNLPQHKVEPLAILDPKSPFIDSYCMKIAAMIIAVNLQGKTYFPKKARQWLSNLLLAYVSTVKKRSLSGFMAILNMIENNFNEFETFANGTFKATRNPYINRTIEEIITKRKTAPEEYSGIMSNIFTDMAFMEDRNIRELFSGEDFSLDVLSQTNPPADVSICIPAQTLASNKTVMRLIIGVAMLYQYKNTASKPLFVIDEAGQLGHFEELEEAYTYGRSFFRTLSVNQDLGQIKKNYGDAGVTTFLGSSQVKIFLGIRDIESANLVSSMFGNQTIEVDNLIYKAQARLAHQQAMNNLMFNGADPFQTGLELAHWKKEYRHKDKIKRPLYTPDEILNLSNRQSIIFLSGKDTYPFIGERMPYYQDNNVKHHFKPNPYHL